VVTALALVVIGYRRRQPAATALAAIGAVAVVSAVLSLTVAEGPLFPYLAVWMQPLVLPIWMGAALLVPAINGVGLKTLPIGLASVTAGLSFNHGAASALSVDYGRQAWAVVAPTVAAQEGKPVLVHLSTVNSAPIAAAIADQAARHGYATRLDPEWVFLLDPGLQSNGRETVEITVCCGPNDRPGQHGTRVLGYVGTVPILSRTVHG
jgi:hypothetical protein